MTLTNTVSNFNEVELSERDNRKVELLKRIVGKTCGDVTTVELQQILEVIDIDKDYEIHVTHDPKEFENTLTLKNYRRANDMHGSEGAEEFGTHIIGEELAFGYRMSMEEFSSMTTNSNAFKFDKPEFDKHKTNIVSIHRHVWNNWEGNGIPQFDVNLFVLNIYVPRMELVK